MQSIRLAFPDSKQRSIQESNIYSIIQIQNRFFIKLTLDTEKYLG
jgi:hypothetical protein